MTEPSPEDEVDRMVEEAAPRPQADATVEVAGMSAAACRALAAIRAGTGGVIVDGDDAFRLVTCGVCSAKRTFFENSEAGPFNLTFQEETCTVQGLHQPTDNGGPTLVTFDLAPLLRNTWRVELTSRHADGDMPPWGTFFVPRLSGPAPSLAELRLHNVGLSAALVDSLAAAAGLRALYLNGLLLESCQLGDLPALRTLHVTLTSVAEGAELEVCGARLLTDVLLNTARRTVSAVATPGQTAEETAWDVRIAPTLARCVSFRDAGAISLRALHLALHQQDLPAVLEAAKPDGRLGFRSVTQVSLALSLRELEPSLYVPAYGDVFLTRAGSWELARATLRELGAAAGTLTLAQLFQAKFTAQTLVNDVMYEEFGALLQRWAARQLTLSDEAAVALRLARPAWPLLAPPTRNATAADMLAAHPYAYPRPPPAALLNHVSIVAVAHTDLVEPEPVWWVRPAQATVYRTNLLTARHATRANVTPVAPKNRRTAPEPVFACDGLACIVDLQRWALFRAGPRDPEDVDLVVFVDAGAAASLPPEATEATTAKAMLAGSTNAARYAVQVWPERDTASTGMLSGLLGGMLGGPTFHANTNATSHTTAHLLGDPRFEAPAT